MDKVITVIRTSIAADAKLKNLLRLTASILFQIEHNKVSRPLT
jgi:hypothetical protein